MARARRSHLGGLGFAPLLFVVVFGGASVFTIAMLLHVARQAWVLRSAEVAGARGATEGRRRFEGVIGASSAGVTAPSGARGVGYYAELGRYDSGKKSRTYAAVCTRAELGGVALVEPGGARRPVADLLGPGEVTYAGRSFPSLRRPTPRLHAPLSDVGPPPARMLELCGASSGDALLYGEHVFREGERLEAIACARGGRVEPCGDGYDVVTTTSMARIREETSLGNSFLTVFASLWVTASVGAGGFAVARRIPRLRRKEIGA